MVGGPENGLEVLFLQRSLCPKEGAVMIQGKRRDLILHSTLTQLRPSSRCSMDFSGRAKHS